VNGESWNQIAFRLFDRPLAYNRQGIKYLTDAWWPIIEDLVKEHIPFRIFTQQAGHLVWIAPGTVHWVQSLV